MFIDLVLQHRKYKDVDEKTSFEYKNIEETTKKLKSLLSEEDKKLVDDLVYYLSEHWDYLHFIEYDNYLKVAFITGLEVGEFKNEYDNY